MTLYAKISRPDLYPSGYGYICDFDDLKDMIDSELDGVEEGEIIQIEIINRKEEDFQNLEEFSGW